MKTMVFGKRGQIAWELQRSLAVLGEVKAVGSDEVCFSRPDEVVSALREYRPDFVVNACGYTAVDKAEDEEQLASIINGHSVGVLADEARKLNIPLVHYSTDYVFDGSKSGAYLESDEPSPINAYGRSKLLGEKLIQQVGGHHAILRVSWVYGARGANFYRTMLRLGEEREELAVVDDQIGAPTWCRHLSDGTVHVLMGMHKSNISGIFHLTPQGQTSWCGFASEIFRLNHEHAQNCTLRIKSVKAIKTAEYPTRAKRPLNSVMSSGKIADAFGIELPHWSTSLRLVSELG